MAKHKFALQQLLKKLLQSDLYQGFYEVCNHKFPRLIKIILLSKLLFQRGKC